MKGLNAVQTMKELTDVEKASQNLETKKSQVVARLQEVVLPLLGMKLVPADAADVVAAQAVAAVESVKNGPKGEAKSEPPASTPEIARSAPRASSKPQQLKCRHAGCGRMFAAKHHLARHEQASHPRKSRGTAGSAKKRAA